MVLGRAGRLSFKCLISVLSSASTWKSNPCPVATPNHHYWEASRNPGQRPSPDRAPFSRHLLSESGTKPRPSKLHEADVIWHKFDAHFADEMTEVNKGMEHDQGHAFNKHRAEPNLAFLTPSHPQRLGSTASKATLIASTSSSHPSRCDPAAPSWCSAGLSITPADLPRCHAPAFLTHAR